MNAGPASRGIEDHSGRMPMSITCAAPTMSARVVGEMLVNPVGWLKAKAGSQRPMNAPSPDRGSAAPASRLSSVIRMIWA